MKEVTIYYAPERMVFKDPADALAVDKGPADHLIYYSDYVDVLTKLQTAESELVKLREENERLKAKYALADHTVEGLHEKLQAANDLLVQTNIALDKIDDHIRIMYNEGLISMKEMCRALTKLTQPTVQGEE